MQNKLNYTSEDIKDFIYNNIKLGTQKAEHNKHKIILQNISQCNSN